MGVEGVVGVERVEWSGGGGEWRGGEWWSGVEWLLLACSCVSGGSKPTLGAPPIVPLRVGPCVSRGRASRHPANAAEQSDDALLEDVLSRALRRDRALFISARRSALEVCRLASRSFLSLPVACVDASLVTVRYP